MKTRMFLRKDHYFIFLIIGLLCLAWSMKKYITEHDGNLLNLFSWKNKGADLIVFSYDRPLQLFAFLESVHLYMTGLDSISVIYRVSNDKFEKGYQYVRDEFQNVHFYEQVNPPHDFKKLLLKALFHDTKADYFLCAVEDMVVTDSVDVADCIRLLEQEKGAYGFYLRLGTNITYCYTINAECGVPDLQLVVPGVYSWVFEKAHGDWGLPVTTDMTVYRKKSCKDIFEKHYYWNPNVFEELWGNSVGRAQKGLCYEYSKNVNVPLNLVQECKWHRSMNFFSTDELLEEFLAGLKINIKPFEKIRNFAPHMEYLPEFVVR